MSSGKMTLPHTCPKCGKITSNETELRDNDNSGNKSVRNQSWCKECR